MSKKNNLVVFVDVESSGLPIKRPGYHSFFDPKELNKYDSSRLIAISWCICDFKGCQKLLRTIYIKPEGFTITNSEIHGITQEKANELGISMKQMFDQLEQDLKDVKVMVAHNLEFDYNVIMSELHRLGNKKQLMNRLANLEKACTGEQTRDLLKISFSSTYNNQYKMPKLNELYMWCFKKNMENHHDPEQDVIHLKEIFFHLLKV